MAYRRMCTVVKTAMALLLSKLGMLFKLSWIVGSFGVMFSLSSFSMPLVGLYSGVLGTSLVWAILFVIRIFSASLSLSSLAYYIPGYCAALYLASESRLFRMGIGLLCMLLFLIHPIGLQAAPYTLYWIIPTVIGMGFFKSLFAQALGATFAAHAIGSVIWIYTVPMGAESWLALIPVVAVERITFAAGIVIVHHSILALSSCVMGFKKYMSLSYPAIR